MTKKDFERLAEALRHVRPVKEAQPQRQQWERDVAAVANICRESNLQFDRERFRKACGIEE